MRQEEEIPIRRTNDMPSFIDIIFLPPLSYLPKANSEAPSKYLFIRTAKRPNGFEASHKEIVA